MTGRAKAVSRISKLLIDRDGVTADAARQLREAHTIKIKCGSDLRGSRGLQLAALTIAHVASRCFPNAVRAAVPALVAEARCLVWPSVDMNLGQAFSATGVDVVTPDGRRGTAAHTFLVGDASAELRDMRITFDDWIASAGPLEAVGRLAEREGCPVAPVLAGALGVSELFCAVHGVTVAAGRRHRAMSLWRPELDVSDPAAQGPAVRSLPGAAWALGLGHLGNAYLWSLAALPYSDPHEVVVFLMDNEEVELENIETGVLYRSQDVGKTKARVCAAWLEAHGFRARIIERRLDAAFRRRGDEPALALCGFDSNTARRLLPIGGFVRVIECGLGGAVSNFDLINIHTVPNSQSPDDMWPDVDLISQNVEAERLARENRGYAELAADECGRVVLAGQSIAIPFVGVAASSFVLAEALRAAHDGPAYEQIKFRTSSSLEPPHTRSGDNYGPLDAAPMKWLSRLQ
jgi:hypothetical protein